MQKEHQIGVLVNRFIAIKGYANVADAGQDLAAGIEGAYIQTSNSVQPYVRVRIVYEDLPAPEPQIAEVSFFETQSATEAQAKYDYIKPLATTTGMVTTTEGTIIVWWF